MSFARPAVLTIAAVLLFTPAGPAQQTVFHEDFDTGYSFSPYWTAADLWHFQDTYECYSPIPSPRAAYWYHQAGTYSCGTGSPFGPGMGDLVSPSFVLAGQGPFSVRFTYFKDPLAEPATVSFQPTGGSPIPLGSIPNGSGQVTLPAGPTPCRQGAAAAPDLVLGDARSRLDRPRHDHGDQPRRDD
jgi:hypothetical protein